jgi:putative phosphoesterase
VQTIDGVDIMKINILVFSDSHRDVEAVRQVLTLYGENIHMAVHLGDHDEDLTACKREFPALEMYTVAGNCDPYTTTARERILNVNGCRILLLHGHHQNVKTGSDRLAYYAEEKGVNACLFGHTHRPAEFVRGPVYFFNPGSLGEPRAGERPSYGLLAVSEDGVIKGKARTL